MGRGERLIDVDSHPSLGFGVGCVDGGCVGYYS